MVVINLAAGLVARHPDFLRVDHNDIITGIHMWGKFRLVFASQTNGDLCRQTAEGLVRGINHVPAVRYRFFFCGISSHDMPKDFAIANVTDSISDTQAEMLDFPAFFVEKIVPNVIREALRVNAH